MSGMRHTKKLIGGYTPSRRLGRGKYGVCYLAADSRGQDIFLFWNIKKGIPWSSCFLNSITKSVPGNFFASDPSLPGSLLISLVEVSSTGICGCQTFYMTDALFPLLISGFHGTKERRV